MRTKQSCKIKTDVQRQEKEAAERAAAVSHMSLGAAGVWGSAISNLSWASRASSVGMPSASHQSSQQVGCCGAPAIGFRVVVLYCMSWLTKFKKINCFKLNFICRKLC